MKPIIIPAILSKNKEELKVALAKIKSFSKRVQIDIGDGVFVKNKTVSLEEIDNFLLNDFLVELHLMVSDPFSSLVNIKKLKPEKVFIHFEAIKKKNFSANQIKNFNFEVGLAINPKTKTEDFKEYIPYFENFLFLSVTPGFQGQKFIDEVLFKIKRFKEKYPFKKIGIDGGVNDKNIEKIYKLGVDEIIVGSFILNNQSPKNAFFQLLKNINAF